ncbi:MAG: hydrogenase formation protein HypD [Promethearchaeota archaeon]
MIRFDKKGIFHDPKVAKSLIQKIGALVRDQDRKIRIMHVCGTHEHVIAESGIRSLLPSTIEVVSGPGCPVCVCHVDDINKAIYLANKGHVIATFGDMLRVPSSLGSLKDCRAEGRDVRVVYSISDAIKIALDEPNKEVIFFAVGFETFAPVVASSILSGIPDNLSFLCSLKTIPPIMELLLALGYIGIDGFITPGHVSAIIGTKPYDLFASAYKMPIVTTGFQPNDILLALAMIMKQINENSPRNENEYKGVVRRYGNKKALEDIKKVFRESTVYWRGIGPVPKGGYVLADKFSGIDATIKFDLDEKVKLEDEKNKGIPHGCSCHLVITGQLRPSSCPLFKSGRCNPQFPIGPCMVSDEGTCRIAFYHEY